MLMFLASVLNQIDPASEHIQKGSVHDAHFGLATAMSGFRNGPEIPELPERGRETDLIPSARDDRNGPIAAFSYVFSSLGVIPRY
jgi:hypothetical protein